MRRSGPPIFAVAVNVAAAQCQEGLVQIIVNALAASRLRPERLELEVTESALLRENSTTLGVLHKLRALGVRIAMDDFGTGYSSLSYLRSFPFDKIKIDQSFVRDMTANSDCLAIVRAVVGLGASFGVPITTEGVETKEQLEQLRNMRCIYARVITLDGR
jgi:EAL domain-containing protein (putative c-di-GMP-specific phosphodiesterase class I)